jgi:hypothetical protein
MMMRDIRADLQERADLIEKQITASNDDFEHNVEQLRRRFKAKLGALSVAMMAEHCRATLTLSAVTEDSCSSN